MLAVYKYTIPMVDYAEVEMKIGSRILHIGDQGNRICVWALVNPDEGSEVRKFRVVETGSLVDETMYDLLDGYVGTVSLFNGEVVEHVFEIGQEFNSNVNQR